MSEVLNTPFTEIHMGLGAKMAPFAGYNMPISYTGINDEHATVRNAVGVFDVSHMGEFILKGPDALDLIQRVTSNDASVLENGKAQYSCLPNETGGIVDDLLVYCIEKNSVYMLVVNASNIEKDWNWISKHNTFGVEMVNMSEEFSLLAVQGPNAVKALQKLTAWGCHSFSSTPIINCSHGMKKLVGLTLATVEEPELLILDEPYTGLDVYHIQYLKLFMFN